MILVLKLEDSYSELFVVKHRTLGLASVLGRSEACDYIGKSVEFPSGLQLSAEFHVSHPVCSTPVTVCFLFWTM